MRLSRCLHYAIAMGLVTLSAWVQGEPLKIVHVMSYSSDWAWNQDQLRGFREGLGMTDAIIRVVELDAKHKDATQLKAAAKEAIDLIENWQPDLVYTNDDVAQAEVSVKFINSKIPFVYSGVNKEHRDYGFDKAGNVTGVLEREHFAGTLSLLREIKPVRNLRLAIVLDDDPTWVGVASRIRAELARRKDVEVVEWLQPKTFEEYKSRMLALQGKVDAVGLLGVFRFTKPGGGYADYEEVLHWTADNSGLMDFSFWDTRVERGTLLAVTVSGVEQGRLAGRMARRILVDKVSPASIPPEATAKGQPMISLARARKLGLPIKSSVLLNAQVLPRFAWGS
ncbi:ABC transporter substrate binding protein [Uliginosibacterium sp. H3]|uniref:ABC transporter substrate binding protein n=1 Tax=Uliginosibacterium silvisoli TaxID=3114758 RepID=A0ABU6K087_9RHOO|nr:ABC transporter substrate binding protein [Uliginosibacterium sp. H3]